MGLGNGNPNEGNKGSNFNYELKTLQLLDAIAVAVEGGGGGGGLTCTTVEDCALIKSIKGEVQDFGTQLATIESACFEPDITSSSGTASPTRGQYQKVGNIVTMTVTFEVTGTTNLDAVITIKVPILEGSSDLSGSFGLIMGSITALSINAWRNLDFANALSDGVDFYVRCQPTSSVSSTYTAHISYAYDTSLC
jgi:hypothetical protein